MSQIRLYLDEDAMHRRLLAGLRARGVDVTTPVEAQRTGESDESLLIHATGDGRTVYTFNVGDFCRLHAEFLRQGRGHAGIIVVPRQRYAVGEQLRRLLRLIQARPLEEMRNHLEFL